MRIAYLEWMPLKAKTFLLCLIVVFSLFVSVPSSAQTVTSDYEVEGDHVWVDNLNIRLEIWPHTSSGGWVYLNFTSKVFAGVVDLVFGFDTEVHRPSKFEFYQPELLTTYYNESIPIEYFVPGYGLAVYDDREPTPSIPGTVNYTILIRSYGGKAGRYYVGGIAEFWHRLPSSQGGWELVRSVSFDIFNGKVGKNWFYFHLTKTVNWHIVHGNSFDRISFSYGDMDRWYGLPFTVVAGKSYYARFWLDLLPTTEKENLGKYWVAVKRHSESFFDAVRFRHFYALDPWWNATFPYKMKLTTNSSRIDADLTDFPFMVHLTSARINWTQVQDDCDDFRLVDESGTPTVLDAELEDYTTNSEAWIDFRGPSVDGDADQDFYLYWGNPTAGPAWDAEGVWDSNYVMVQHMVDNPDTSHITDSTSNNNDGTKGDAGAPTEIAAKINGGQDFGVVQEYINLGDVDALAGEDHVYSFWVRPTMATGAPYQFMFSKWSGTGFIIGQAVFDNKDLIIYDDLGLPMSFNDFFQSSNVIWYHVVVKYVDAENKIYAYRDGNQIGSVVYGTVTNSAANFYIGRFASYVFTGVLDEVRVSDNLSVYSNAWIKAEYWSGLDGLLTYGSSSTVQPPTIGQFQAPAIVYPSKSTWLNVTASYDLGNTSIKNVTLTLTGGVEVAWDESTKAFSEVADPNNYFTLSANSTYANVNSTSYMVCFKGTFVSTYPEGYKTGIGEVYTDDDLSASHTETDWFLFSVPPIDFTWVLALVIALAALSLILLYKER